MSWWPVPDSPDDVTGDAPADAVDEALVALGAARASAGLPKPLLQELVRALQDACEAERGLFADLGAVSTVRVAASGVGPAERAPDDLQAAVGRALREVAAHYRRVFERAPRLSEALYAFTFVFGGRAPAFVRDPPPGHVAFKSS